MAGICDPNTGKIIGVKRGSWGWWHEKGHIEYPKTKWGLRLQFYSESFFKLSLLFVIIYFWFQDNNYAKILPSTTIILHILLELYEEFWCWTFASKKFKTKV